MAPHTSKDNTCPVTRKKRGAGVNASRKLPRALDSVASAFRQPAQNQKGTVVSPEILDFLNRVMPPLLWIGHVLLLLGAYRFATTEPLNP